MTCGQRALSSRSPRTQGLRCGASHQGEGRLRFLQLPQPPDELLNFLCHPFVCRLCKEDTCVTDSAGTQR